MAARRTLVAFTSIFFVLALASDACVFDPRLQTMLFQPATNSVSEVRRLRIPLPDVVASYLGAKGWLPSWAWVTDVHPFRVAFDALYPNQTASFATWPVRKIPSNEARWLLEFNRGQAIPVRDGGQPLIVINVTANEPFFSRTVTEGFFLVDHHGRALDQLSISAGLRHEFKQHRRRTPDGTRFVVRIAGGSRWDDNYCYLRSPTQDRWIKPIDAKRAASGEAYEVCEITVKNGKFICLFPSVVVVSQQP